MKLYFLSFLLLTAPRANGFSPLAGRTSFSSTTRQVMSATVLKSSLFDDNVDDIESAKRMQQMAAEQMKNLKREDLEKMVEEMENMNPVQRTALKAMGMDPEMMKKTVEMMRDNPNMVKSAQKLMENMTPEELMEQSRKAQEQMKGMTANDMDQANKMLRDVPEETINEAVQALSEKKQKEAKVVDAAIEDADEEDLSPRIVETGPGSHADKEVIDSMFRVAEFMSNPPSGGCTFAGFASLPIIQLLSGDREFDLSPSELKECWAYGSLGATRVDRAGFERVWMEVQDFFEDDMMGEARKEAKKRASSKSKRGKAKSAAVSTPAAPPAPSKATTSASTGATSVGENLSPEQLKEVNERVRDMSDSEVDMMLSQMENMGAAEEARMRAMGVDPAMMKRTAKMMKNNPMMREAAKEMVKNMSPEDMLKTSKQAQEQMAGMSQEDIEKAMDQLSGDRKD